MSRFEDTPWPLLIFGVLMASEEIPEDAQEQLNKMLDSVEKNIKSDFVKKTVQVIDKLPIEDVVSTFLTKIIKGINKVEQNTGWKRDEILELIKATGKNSFKLSN